jgi:hypothetical protein
LYCFIEVPVGQFAIQVEASLLLADVGNGHFHFADFASLGGKAEVSPGPRTFNAVANLL